MKKKHILIILANPRGSSRLNLEKERHVIEEALSRLPGRAEFETVFIEACTVRDLRRILIDRKFEILHIAAHGQDNGLLLEDEQGEKALIPKEAFAELLSRNRTNLECVILNACNSLSQGSLIFDRQIPFVIAMREKLYDAAAIEFSRGFYDALRSGKSFQQAFEDGRLNVNLTGAANEGFSCEFISGDAGSRDSVYFSEYLSSGENSRKQNLQIFTNIWYASKKFSIFDFWRSPDLGTLYIIDGKIIRFEGEKIKISIETAESVSHVRMPLDINNNWVKVDFQGADSSLQTAYFALAEKLGWGNLVGGSTKLFEALRRLSRN